MKRIGKRITAFLLAVMLAMMPTASGAGGSLVSFADESTIRTLFPGNLLKEGSSFSFYGKDVPRNGMWSYQINSNPVFCLEPTKKMYNGATGQVEWYEIGQGNLPFGITVEKAEALYYAMASGGCFEGASANIGKTKGGYMMIQSAVWAIMSDDWDIEKFSSEMENKIIPNAKDSAAAPIIRQFVEEYTRNAKGMAEENACPAFASKHQETAPAHQMQKAADGTYSCMFETDGTWMQNELIFEMPEGWDYQRKGNQITFRCLNGDPNSGIIKGKFPEGSAGARYSYRPTRIAIVTPVGGDQTQRQAQIMMAGEKMPWEVYLQFGAGTIPDTGEGGFTIPYERFQHDETFRRNYNIELVKTDSETGKTLKDSSFEVLEQFDFGQLDGTNLEEEQFEAQDQEGPYHGLSVCTDRITTDDEGHFMHSDEKTYHYEKTYCGGHPDPVIEYVEVGEDASDEEKEAADEENERLEELAWAQWQECVDWCEENCDFHSVTEGNAREEMEADCDEAYDTFIHLIRTYTVREVTARTGYILHDLHNDDIPVNIVEFASSQVESDGSVTGSYPGNRSVPAAIPASDQSPVRATSADATEDTPAASISVHETEMVYASYATASEASPSEAERINSDKKEKKATDSNAEKGIYRVAVPLETGASSGEAGWSWDGILLDSEVPPVDQSAMETNYFGYCFEVADHRTEGEIHIEKRDLELYGKDASEGKTDSYGKTQGDATLENAVYGLYAMDDIIHPDGKTGKVFSAGELVSIASTDKNGAASFVAITEVSETSKTVPNLDMDNPNGNCWIGHPLLLGRYYVQEISRSEGYELSKAGINLTESNRTGAAFPFAEAGTVSVGELGHRLNEWDGSFNDFTVQYFKTDNGFDIMVSGYPEDSTFYRVDERERKSSDHVITGTQSVEKRDEDGNIVYRTAIGGEWKLDGEGKRRLLFDESGSPVYGTEKSYRTVSAASRLKAYITSISREGGEESKDESADIEMDYVLEQVNKALAQAGYKDGLDDYPWEVLNLTGETNGAVIDEILTYCAADGFWDSWRLDDVYVEDGTWYALIRYGYKAVKNEAVVETSSGRLFIRQKAVGNHSGEEKEFYYYTVYEPGEYERRGSSFTISQMSAKELVYGKPIHIEQDYRQLYETYGPGEFLLDLEGNRIPVYEEQPVYSDINSTEYEEVLTALDHVEYDRESGITKIHVDTSGIDWEAQAGAVSQRFRAVGPQSFVEANGKTMAYADYLKEYMGASVSAFSTRLPFAEGSYAKEVVLLYPGQWEIYQDSGTRISPVIVQQRCIKQAIKVTKDIAQDSYEEMNTYKIHRDPFTVLFGGYKDPPAKTIKGFYFKAYLRQDLINTGKLQENADGGYDYEAFFADNPEYGDSLAVAWDNPRYDRDHDLTTVHADRGGGKDDYYGTSIMLPYGTYVIVEQQPVTIPTKHYAIDRPKEITLPFVPQIDADGTVHDKVVSDQYLYDAEMTAEEMMEQYHIRFMEESHVIYAHNNDGDYEIFKYGLEPDLARDCQNETVARYYHYASLSENAGKKDQVYYEVYRDRDGTILDYGATKDNVDTMTGVSTMVDRLYAPALVPWSVLDERYGEVINDQGDVGNREAGLTDEGKFNYVSFAAEDFENHFYGSRLRIEKLDSETGENIIHEGALFKIYAAKRDIMGDGPDGVKGSGKVVFLPDGTPDYDESEQIFMKDETGAETGIFKALSTIRDGDVEIDGEKVTEKRGVGYILTPQPLGAGVYVLVEVQPPTGYVRSKPIAFEVYSDEVSYYPQGSQTAVTAPKYQYVKEISPGGDTVWEDVSQIKVFDTPTHVDIHKVEAGDHTITYRVEGTEGELLARGDVTLYYEANGAFAGYGFVTKQLDEWSERQVEGTLEELESQEGVRPVYDDSGIFTGHGIHYRTYVPRATLTMYQGLKLRQTGEHEFEGVEVKRNWNDSVLKITASHTGSDMDIRKTGVDSQGNDIWDMTNEQNPPAELYRYDLKNGAVEQDKESGILYGLDAYGNRVCLVDSFTGLAYVKDNEGSIIAWPLDENGKKIKAEQIKTVTGPDGKETIYEGLSAVTDVNGLPVYYADGSVLKADAEWVTPIAGPYHLSRVPSGTYIIEETVSPHAFGFIKSMAVGLIVEETGALQQSFMEDDFTKVEIAKLDRETGMEVIGAEMTLYEAERVPDTSLRGWHLEAAVDFDGEKIPYCGWISGYQYDDDGEPVFDSLGNPKTTTKPHWLDHIPPGDYLLEETGIDQAFGYVRAADIEVIVEENGTVQQFVMYDDHTAVEFLKTDSSTGKALDNQKPARLALYEALLNEKGEVQYGADGLPQYHKEKKVLEWVTDDGKTVAETGHEVTTPSGTEVIYDYEYHQIPGSPGLRYYVTETGALHIDYLPIGKYVWVEEGTPTGMQTADPIYIPVLEIGSAQMVQKHEMVNHPITVELTKTFMTGGTELAGATMAVYRAAPDGSNPKKQKLDSEGNPIPVLDAEDNPVYDMSGNPLMEEMYPETFLVDRWISGTDGRYTEEEVRKGQVPASRKAGDLKPHTITGLVTGVYYYVEEAVPFGYARGDDLRFEVTGAETPMIEMVDSIVQGRLEIQKYDKNDSRKPLAGAKFLLENLDTNEAIILITGKDGRVVTGYMPIGAVSIDGAVSLYHFRLREVEPPAHYELDPEIHTFSFAYKTDRVERVTYHYGAPNKETVAMLSKVDITNNEELAGAGMRLEEADGTVIEEWVSGDIPHEIVGKLKAGEHYVLIEESAPAGYTLSERIEFTVGKDGRIEPVIMKDRPTDVIISKKGVTGEEELPGAKMQLRKPDGTVLREWVSGEEPYRLTGILEAGEHYILSETAAPDGWAYVEEITFCVSEDGSVDRVVMRDKPTHIRVSKTDGGGVQGLPGAHMEIRDLNGNTVVSWISDGEKKEIKGILAAEGEYVLHEELPPDGYAYSEDIRITVALDGEVQEVTMADKPTKVSVSKKGITGEEELPGAKLQIETLDGVVVQEWISGTEPKILTGILKADTDYILREVLAPEGYAYSEAIQFHVSRDGSVDVVVMRDKPTKAVLSKKQMTGEEELPGAELQLVDREGRVVEEWKSGSEPYEIAGRLIAGETYRLREKTPAAGWAYAEDVPFTVNKDGTVNLVVMRDKPTHVEVSKQTADGRELAGAHLQILDSSGNVVKAWVSNGERTVLIGELAAGKEYLLVETQAPSGYEVAASVPFQVSTDGSIQVILMYDRLRTSGGGGGEHTPVEPWMTLRKVNEAGEGLAGAEITVYREDGTVLLSGTTGQGGTIRFAVPQDGVYTYRETQAPANYLLNSAIGRFEVKGKAVVADTLTLVDIKAPEVVIRKVDAETRAPLAGAKIGIYREGIQVYEGVTGADGRILYLPDTAGDFSYRELESPQGYQITDTVYRFEITEKGEVSGELEIVNYRTEQQIGSILATYHGSGRFTGTHLHFGDHGKITFGPKTGDNTPLLLYLLLLVASAGTLTFLWIRRCCFKRLTFLLLSAAFAITVSQVSYADVQGENQTQQERIFYTSDPSNVQPDFNETMEKRGITYQLIHVENTIVEEADIPVENETITVTSAPFKEGTEPPEAETVYYSEGISYVLKESKLIDSSLGDRKKDVSREEVYEEVEQADSIPEYCYVDIYDELAQESYTRQIPLSDYEFEDYHWVGGFELPITFQEYDAGHYALGNTLIEHDDMRPALDGQYDRILDLIGVSSDFYQIENVSWVSEPWTGEDGVSYRSALAQGKKLVGTCRARYSGTVTLEDYPAKALEMTYMRVDAGDSQEKQYTIRSTATYQALTPATQSELPADQDSGKNVIWNFIMQHPVISIGAALILLFLISILFILAGKRSEKRDETL